MNELWIEKNYKQMLLDGTGSLNYNKGIAKKYGANVAILLGLLCYKYDYWIEKEQLTEDGYFFVTQEDIEEETGLSPHQQREALKILKDKGILNIYRKGIPPKNYYKLNYLTLKSEIIKSNKLKNLTYIDEEIEPIKVKKLNTTNKEILIKETNKDITKESISKDNLNDHSPLSDEKENNDNYKGRSGDLGNSKSQTMVRSQVYSNYTGELGEVIVKWYNAVGVNRRITFNQIKDKVDQLRQECKGDENTMVKQINYSYLNGYPTWYPPKNYSVDSYNSVSTDVDPERSNLVF